LHWVTALYTAGRDSYPLLLKRGRLLKDAKRGTSYNWRDLFIGTTVNLYNRPLLLVDADGHTREFYEEQVHYCNYLKIPYPIGATHYCCVVVV
jgi:DUF1126 PH-like domain